MERKYATTTPSTAVVASSYPHIFNYTNTAPLSHIEIRKKNYAEKIN